MEKPDKEVIVKLGPGEQQALVAVLDAVRQAAGDHEVVLRIVNETAATAAEPTDHGTKPHQFRPHFWWQSLAKYDPFVPFMMMASVTGFLTFHLTGIAPA